MALYRQPEHTGALSHPGEISYSMPLCLKPPTFQLPVRIKALNPLAPQTPQTSRQHPPRAVTHPPPHPGSDTGELYRALTTEPRSPCSPLPRRAHRPGQSERRRRAGHGRRVEGARGELMGRAASTCLASAGQPRCAGEPRPLAWGRGQARLRRDSGEMCLRKRTVEGCCGYWQG